MKLRRYLLGIATNCRACGRPLTWTQMGHGDTTCGRKGCAIAPPERTGGPDA